HRPAGIDQDFGARADLFAIEAYHERVAAGIRPPVEMPDVVAGDVLAVLLKLERTSRAASQQFPRTTCRRHPRQTELERLDGSLNFRIVEHGIFACGGSFFAWIECDKSGDF